MTLQISSHLTFFSKWVVPLAWFGGLAFVMGQAMVTDSAEADIFAVLIPVVMIVLGFLFFKTLLWDLADAVYDHGSYLQVRRGSVEDRISLDNVMNVSSTPMMNPPRVTLRLVKPCAFGTHVSFLPKSSLLSLGFSTPRIAEQLIERAYAARGKRTG